MSDRSTTRLVVEGGRVVDPSQKIDQVASVLLEDGRVKSVGTSSAPKSWRRFDARDCVVVPGLIDMHVHFREPGQEGKETVATGSEAAVTGGFTSVVCMPDTVPINDNRVVTSFIRGQAKRADLANVFLAGAITQASNGQDLAAIGEMVEAGIVAITDDDRPVVDNQMMRRAMEYARDFDVLVIDHCEDPSLASNGCINEGLASSRLGLPGLSGVAEELHVARDLMLSRYTGAKVHIASLSTAGSLGWVRHAKAEEIPVTCEVTPHHFLLSDEDIVDFDTNFKTNPPLRSRKDVAAIIEGIVDGAVDCIVSDHRPQSEAEKETTFEQAAPGVVGLETTVPLVWDRLVKTGLISVSRFVELLSLNPARILKLGRGTFQEGAPADLTVIDPEEVKTVDVSRFRSKARNCPFQGWELSGWPKLTVARGVIKYASS